MTEFPRKVGQKTSPRIVFGIESSCDETACALVSEDRQILAQSLWSQQKEHERYGGVVPERAARAHLQRLPQLLTECVESAGISLHQISAVAGVAGPGLIGGVMVGMMAAKGIALALGRPFLAINHLEAHALTPRLVEDIPFPYLLLLVSGGHTQLLMAKAVGEYQLLGTTRDDAVGEAFDKTAKIMGLPYPGGPAVEQEAQSGDARRFTWTKPLANQDTLDFSFSGLKTAGRQTVESHRLLSGGNLEDPDRADICASFQYVVGEILKDRVDKALHRLDETPKALVCAGGVASNKTLRHVLEDVAARHGIPFYAPPLSLCTDNGAMIAWAGIERLKKGEIGDPLSFGARPRWPLEKSEEISK